MAQAFETVFLEPEEAHFCRTGDTLSLDLPDGRHFARVVLRCCFPVWNEKVFLSVRDAGEREAFCDEQEEIGILRDWTTLPAEDRQAVAQELGLHYFVPQIVRILSIREEFGFLYWSVETDKGPKDFIMRDSIVTYVREVAPNHLLIIDMNQARYEITDTTVLDSRSKKLMRRFLYL
ncbi:MAG: DUF1854 domain-containing protein [Anaerolineae bacterium]